MLLSTWLILSQQSSEGLKDGEPPSILARIVALSVSVDPTSEDDLQSFISRYMSPFPGSSEC